MDLNDDTPESERKSYIKVASDRKASANERLKLISTFVIAPERLKFEAEAVTRGGFGDVRRARLRPADGKGKKRAVAVKEIRFARGIEVERTKKVIYLINPTAC